MEYYERIVLEKIKKWIDRKEIIAIKGPRQSGKTTLLEMLKRWLLERGTKEENIVYLTFEDREILEQFTTNPKDFVKRFVTDKERYYFLIDEAHYCKDIGQKLKLLYDIYKNIKFVITGSSSLEITSSTAKFLVGRLFSFELLPFSFFEFLNAKDKRLAKMFLERNESVIKFITDGKDFEIPRKDIFLDELLNHLNEFLIFGGYPEIVKTETEETKRIILKNIFDTYLEKDIISYLQITDTIKFRKLISALSYLAGNLISYENLTNICNSYFKEINHLLDVLQQTYIIRILRPFHKNLVTELRKNPKVYFFDQGLRNYAINNFNNLEIREDASRLAENFVLNEISSFVEEKMFLNFWRTTAKAEVDLVLSAINRLIPIEVKYQSFKTPKVSRGLRNFIKSYKTKNALVITKDFWGKAKINDTNVVFVPVCYL